MSILYWMLAAASADPSMSQAQMAYMDCLSRESDAAVRQRVAAEKFEAVADQLCEDETRDYRAAIARQGGAQQFATADAQNRAALIASYKNRMRARRSRIAPPPMPSDVAAEPTEVRYVPGSTQ